MNTHGKAGWPGVPPPQHNLREAADRAVESLRGQTSEQLRWLGAEPAGNAWRIEVLGQSIDADIRTARVVAGGKEVRPAWRILTLHYLAITTRPVEAPPQVTFAGTPDGIAYARAYEKRVIGRFCATAGRSREALEAAAALVAATCVEVGDAAFDITVFPRVRMRLVWYAPDDEFASSATLLLPGNIESFFCAEDIVVLSECLVSRMSGGSF